MSLDVARSGVAPSLANLASLAFACLAWGFSYPLTHIALEGIDFWSLRVAVMLLGGGALLGFVALSGGSLHVPRSLWRDVAIGGLFNFTLFQLGMMFGVYFMGAGRTSVLVYTMPLWATLFARLMLGERVTRRRAMALGLGMLAIVVLLGQGLDQMRNAPAGALLTLLAAASFGFGTVWVKRRPVPIELPVLVGWQLLFAALPFVAVWLVTVHDMGVLGAPASAWFAILFIGLLSSATSYALWFRVVSHLPAAVASVGTLVTPCVGVLSSALIIGETIRPNDLIALALVCAALVLVLFERRPAESGA